MFTTHFIFSARKKIQFGPGFTFPIVSDTLFQVFYTRVKKHGILFIHVELVDMPLSSIIIPTSRTDTVNSTLQAVFRQGVPDEDYEVILVVPHNTRITEFHDARLKTVYTDRLYPPGRMRNIGARHASGEYFFFVDDDCTPPPVWLDDILKIFHNYPETGAVGCRVVSTNNSFWERCADYTLFSRYQYRHPFQGNLGSAAIALRRLAFESIDGFEETLLASEDWDLSLKLEKSGWTCRFSPAIEIKHDHRRGSFLRILVMGFKSGFRSGLFVQEKHRESLSPAARMMLKLKHPVVYPIMIIPYAGALTLFLIWDLWDTDRRIPLFAPFIFFSRLSYQIGVWTRLIHETRCF